MLIATTFSFRNNLPLTEQPIYNIVATTPTYLKRSNDSNNHMKAAEHLLELDLSENCTKCVEKCGADCKLSCHSIFDCNLTSIDYYDDSNLTDTQGIS